MAVADVAEIALVVPAVTSCAISDALASPLGAVVVVPLAAVTDTPNGLLLQPPTWLAAARCAHTVGALVRVGGGAAADPLSAYRAASLAAHATFPAACRPTGVKRLEAVGDVVNHINDSRHGCDGGDNGSISSGAAGGADAGTSTDACIELVANCSAALRTPAHVTLTIAVGPPGPPGTPPTGFALRRRVAGTTVVAARWCAGTDRGCAAAVLGGSGGGRDGGTERRMGDADTTIAIPSGYSGWPAVIVGGDLGDVGGGWSGALPSAAGGDTSGPDSSTDSTPAATAPLPITSSFLLPPTPPPSTAVVAGYLLLDASNVGDVGGAVGVEVGPCTCAPSPPPSRPAPPPPPHSPVPSGLTAPADGSVVVAPNAVGSAALRMVLSAPHLHKCAGGAAGAAAPATGTAPTTTTAGTTTGVLHCVISIVQHGFVTATATAAARVAVVGAVGGDGSWTAPAHPAVGAGASSLPSAPPPPDTGGVGGCWWCVSDAATCGPRGKWNGWGCDCEAGWGSSLSAASAITQGRGRLGTGAGGDGDILRAAPQPRPSSIPDSRGLRATPSWCDVYIGDDDSGGGSVPDGGGVHNQPAIHDAAPGVYGITDGWAGAVGGVLSATPTWVMLVIATLVVLCLCVCCCACCATCTRAHRRYGLGPVCCVSGAYRCLVLPAALLRCCFIRRGRRKRRSSFRDDDTDDDEY